MLLRYVEKDTHTLLKECKLEERLTVKYQNLKCTYVCPCISLKPAFPFPSVL
jgi:hypothetical protein